MKAYAVLDGGGVKGAALAGCLKGAEEFGIEFAGFGGTSAGSIVALLASIGYTPDELRNVMCRDLNFSDFLDDSGKEMTRWGTTVKALLQPKTMGGRLMKGGQLWLTHGADFKERVEQLGIYGGANLEAKLKVLITRKLPKLEGKAEITFADLRREGGLPLKVVAAHLRTREAVVFSDAAGSPTSAVITAVRASCCYPILFRPVMLGSAHFVDGGLASNLPVWLFDAERARTGLQVVAFDLTTKRDDAQVQTTYGASDYVSDMLETALESGDALLRNANERLIHVRVPLDPSYKTLDFGMATAERQALYDQGKLSAISEFVSRFVKAGVLTDRHAQIEASYGSSQFFETALAGLARELEATFPGAGAVRCSVFLPFSEGELFSAYTHGMREAPDGDLALGATAGPPGLAVANTSPILSDWSDIRRDPTTFGMTSWQVNKVPTDRRAVACVPVFDGRQPTQVVDKEELAGLRTRGALYVDCAAGAQEAGWSPGPGQFDSDLLDILKRWADLVGRIMT